MYLVLFSADDQHEIYIPIFVKVLLKVKEGKRPLGRPRRRWVDNIRMDLQEVGYYNRSLIFFFLARLSF